MEVVPEVSRTFLDDWRLDVVGERTSRIGGTSQTQQPAGGNVDKNNPC